MKYLVTYLCLISLSILPGCNGLFESKDKGLADLKKIEERWSDGINLAGSTSRIALSTPVGNLQSIKRDLDGVVVSECLKNAKGALVGHMELTIQGFLEFMGDKKYVAEQTLEKAFKQMESYKKERSKCID